MRDEPIRIGIWIMARSSSGVPSPAKDPEIEDRIDNEIVVDAYGEYERHVSWQTHLGDRLPFPFEARCIKALPGSPLLRGEKATVTGMFDEAVPAAIRVMIRWQGRELAVPLEQVPGVDPPEEAALAIADVVARDRQGRLSLRQTSLPVAPRSVTFCHP